MSILVLNYADICADMLVIIACGLSTSRQLGETIKFILFIVIVLD